MKLLFSNQYGRSMIEMLGVLAIVGILSVGGIAGYSKAMNKHRNNRSIEDYTFFINNLLLYKDAILKTKTYHIAPILYNLGTTPNNWKLDGAVFYDQSHREIFPFLVNKNIRIEYRLKRNGESFFSNEIKLLCQQLWTDVILPNKDSIYTVVLIAGASSQAGTYYYFGTQYCKKENLCLADITLAQIITECSKCTEEERCVLDFTF